MPDLQRSILRKSAGKAPIGSGLTGVFLAASVAGYECPSCGPLKTKELPRELRDPLRQARQRVKIAGYISIVVIVVILAIMLSTVRFTNVPGR